MPDRLLPRRLLGDFLQRQGNFNEAFQHSHVSNLQRLNDPLTFRSYGNVLAISEGLLLPFVFVRSSLPFEFALAEVITNVIRPRKPSNNCGQGDGTPRQIVQRCNGAKKWNS